MSILIDKDTKIIVQGLTIKQDVAKTVRVD